MSYLGNSPSALTIIRAEARKSYSFGVVLKDGHGRPCDITGSALTLVAKPNPIDDTSDLSNIFAADAYAVIDSPLEGYARFDLQASTMDHEPGEYEFAIVLRTADGYTSVIVKGIIELTQNTEYSSVASTYFGANPTQLLTVLLQRNNSINVFIDGQLPPGMNYVRDSVLEAIESFDPDAVALVPAGGVPGYVLTKNGSGDYTMAWLPLGQGAFGLDATGQAAGRVPVAVGDDTWIWSAVGIDATGATAGWAPVSNGDGTWDWAMVTPNIPVTDWNAAPGLPGEVRNKPSLGTASSRDISAFMAAAQLFSGMPGVHIQATIPAVGVNGHVYLVYQA